LYLLKQRRHIVDQLRSGTKGPPLQLLQGPRNRKPNETMGFSRPIIIADGVSRYRLLIDGELLLQFRERGLLFMNVMFQHEFSRFD
jgi:hypothetical protein